MPEGLLSGPHSAYSRPEFVVGYKHVDTVKDVLEELGVGHEEVDRDADLGLGLLRLHDDRDAAVAVGRNPDASTIRSADAEPTRSVDIPERAASGGTNGSDADRPATELDAFLRGLRRHFRQRFAGWAPIIGKNRMLGHVVGGGGKISHGGGGPLMATEDELPRREGNAGRGVRVGVLDTSMSSNTWLAGAWTSPPGEVLDQDEAAEVAGHATFVGGLVLRQAPACVLHARAVLSNDTGEADSWSVAKAIVQLAQSSPHVINLSFVCYTEDGQPPLALATAIDRIGADTVIVAAAGNHGDLGRRAHQSANEQHGKPDNEGRKPAWPAAFDRVVAVGSASSDGHVSPFTPPDVQWIDVLAPGSEVLSTFLASRVTGHSQPFTGYARWSGTSFAAASVSGAIAARTRPGSRSPQQAWAQLQEEAQHVSGQPVGPAFLSLR
jgi:subtilisin family serine protease